MQCSKVCHKNILFKFFDLINVPRGFLHKDPTCSCLKVVIDSAERVVSLISKYNNILPKDENQTQCLWRGVFDRRQYRKEKAVLNLSYVQFNSWYVQIQCTVYVNIAVYTCVQI